MSLDQPNLPQALEGKAHAVPSCDSGKHARVHKQVAQPIDSHIGFMLEKLIVDEYEKMMEARDDECGDGKISLSEKRVFVTK